MSGQFPWRNIYFLLTCLLGTEQVLAEEVNIAVASNFTAPIKAIAAEFEQQTGHDVKLILGSSGKIFAQIRHGAPFDVFLSADSAKPAALERSGTAVSGSRFTYAIGALALWSANPEFFTGPDLRDGKTDILKKSRFHKLAIANPRLAPYGAAAKELLLSLNLWQDLLPKLVQGENIAQTYQFVATGNADLGFVAVSQIIKGGKLRQGAAWIIPDSMHKPIRQDAVIMKSARDNPAALAFMRFLRSGPAKRLIHAFGYKTLHGKE